MFYDMVLGEDSKNASAKMAFLLVSSFLQTWRDPGMTDHSKTRLIARVAKVSDSRVNDILKCRDVVEEILCRSSQSVIKCFIKNVSFEYSFFDVMGECANLVRTLFEMAPQNDKVTSRSLVKWILENKNIEMLRLIRTKQGMVDILLDILIGQVDSEMLRVDDPFRREIEMLCIDNGLRLSQRYTFMDRDDGGDRWTLLECHEFDMKAILLCELQAAGLLCELENPIYELSEAQDLDQNTRYERYRLLIHDFDPAMIKTALAEYQRLELMGLRYFSWSA